MVLVYPWDTHQENADGLKKGLFGKNQTVFSLVRKSGRGVPRRYVGEPRCFQIKQNFLIYYFILGLQFLLESSPFKGLGVAVPRSA